MKGTLLFVILSLAQMSDASPVPILEDQEMGYALQESTVNPEDSLQFQIVELPSEFNTYDMNKDGSITLNELSDITETESDDATLPFHNADKDGNDMLTKQEFEEAPWVFNIPDRVKFWGNQDVRYRTIERIELVAVQLEIVLNSLAGFVHCG